MSNKIDTIRRGDVFYADLGNQRGSVESGIRPVLVIQNDDGNLNGATLLVAPLTTQIKKTYIPAHEMLLEADGLIEESMVLCEQITTIDKTQIHSFICHVSAEAMARVTKAIRTSVGDDLVPKLPLAYMEAPYEMVMTLCYAHRQPYFDDPMYWVERVDPFQDKETCTLCNRTGYDFRITNVRAKKKYMNQEPSQSETFPKISYK